MLLSDVKNYLDITWEDVEGDEKLTGILARGMAFLDGVAGKKLDYEAESLPRALLFDYTRYVRANALELFSQNFKQELITLRIDGMVSRAKEEGEGML